MPAALSTGNLIAPAAAVSGRVDVGRTHRL